MHFIFTRQNLNFFSVQFT